MAPLKGHLWIPDRRAGGLTGYQSDAEERLAERRYYPNGALQFERFRIRRVWRPTGLGPQTARRLPARPGLLARLGALLLEAIQRIVVAVLVVATALGLVVLLVLAVTTWGG